MPFNPDDYTMDQLEELWDTLEHDENTNWDDLREHDPELLSHKFDLNTRDAELLWAVLQAESDQRRDVYGRDPKQVGEMIQESLHQGLDGWSIREQLVIKAYLGDIGYAINQDNIARNL